MTLIAALEEFITSRKMIGLVDKSLNNYKEFVIMFIKYVGNKDIENLIQKDINNYIMHIFSKPISISSKATYVRHLKVYLRWCSENMQVGNYDYSKIKIPKSPKKNVYVYSDLEIRQIYESIRNNIEWIEVRNKSIISLMLDSGFRQAEITRVLLKDIDYKRSVINVHGKGSKDRIVPIGNISKMFIKRYKKIIDIDINNDEYLFLGKDKKRISTNAIKLMVRSLSSSLDFEFTSHKLRHNFATNWCLNQYKKYGQIDIYQLKYILGHEDVKTTERYLHFAYEYIASERSISHLDNVFNNN